MGQGPSWRITGASAGQEISHIIRNPERKKPDTRPCPEPNQSTPSGQEILSILQTPYFNVLLTRTYNLDIPLDENDSSHVRDLSNNILVLYDERLVRPLSRPQSGRPPSVCCPIQLIQHTLIYSCSPHLQNVQ